MHWNYRVVRKPIKGSSQTYLQITEVYYDSTGKLGFGDAPVPYGDTLEEIRDVLIMMMGALEKDIIDMPFDTE